MTRGLLWVLVCLGVAASQFSARVSGAETKYSTNALEQAACERQLNIIYGALAKYLEDHAGEYPERLSDLCPAYIHDRNVMVCPASRKRGGLRTWNRSVVELSADFYTSYSFELGSSLLPPDAWRGIPRLPWREYKLRLVRIFGLVVPVVRCEDHRPYLNLALDGRIYHSDLYWENNFAHEESQRTIERIFALPPPQPLAPSDFVPRDPRLDRRSLDLTPYYNGLLTNAWQGFLGNDLASLPPGLHQFDGVSFDIRGVIQLHGADLPIPFPDRVEGIKVGQKCSRVHFINALSAFDYVGFTNACYVFHYANGETRELQLLYGVHFADWWPEPAKLPKTDLPAAWSGQNEASRVYRSQIRLFHTIWENALPDVEITSISFDDRGKEFPTGPFVLAITLQE